MILLWGLPGDTPIAHVQGALSRRGCATFFLDERAALETQLRFTVPDASAGTLQVGAAHIELARISAAYQRPYGIDRIPALADRPRGDAAWSHAEAVADALTAWLETMPGRVVNPSSAMASNGSKPYQAQFITAAGLRVPETLITTEPEAVHEFRARHGMLIYKSVSGVRSIVARLTDDKLSRLDLLRWCPTQFQEYVPGDDYRVHVVGDEVFACRIRSDADDYRYAGRSGQTAKIDACALPAALAGKCRLLATTLGLTVAGIDLRRHPTRGWYCFEVNPSPAFTYFAEAADQPIAEAIAALLAG